MNRFLRDNTARVLAGALKLLGPYRLYRLLQAARRTDPAALDRLWEAVFEQALPKRWLSERFVYNYFRDDLNPVDARLTLNPVSPAIRAALEEIPSETTIRERRFLYQFFKYIWSGRGTVVEVGPFLGGTTRAMALGMQDNPRHEPDARLLTFDRFDAYYQPEALAQFLEPLFTNGVLSPADRPLAEQGTSFLDVFRRLHMSQSYAPLLRAECWTLPGKPEWNSADETDLAIRKIGLIDAVFVDGCKAWYSTKKFMSECVPHTPPGAFYIFQDYGWFTCFWIPAFVGLFPECFELLGCVDSTYAFRLMKSLSAAEIDARFPDTPQALGVPTMDRLFSNLRLAAGERKDRSAWVTLELQRAAVWAYIGEKSRAIDIIEALGRNPHSFGFESMIQVARRTPTYYPSAPDRVDWNPVTLDEAAGTESG